MKSLKSKNVYKICVWDDYVGWVLYNELTNKRVAIKEYNSIKNDNIVQLIQETGYRELLMENFSYGQLSK